MVLVKLPIYYAPVHRGVRRWCRCVNTPVRADLSLELLEMRSNRKVSFCVLLYCDSEIESSFTDNQTADMSYHHTGRQSTSHHGIGV